MKTQVRNPVMLLAIILAASFSISFVRAQGTAFTYQGRLNSSGAPADGNYDLRFLLFNVASNGAAIAGPRTNSAVAVSNGLFTAVVDFGSGAFTGSREWLEIGVRTNGASNGFVTLAPRQELTPAPYAIFANTASNVSGTVSAAQLPGNVIYNGAGSVNLTGSFFGNGAGLSNLTASAFAGTIPQSNLGASNAFTPTIGDGVNNFITSVAQGYYTKVGNLVFVEIWLVWTNRGSAINAYSVQISLPVPVGSPRAVFALGYCSGIDFVGGGGTSDQQLIATASQGSSSSQLFSLVSYAGATVMTVINCADNGQIQLSGFYRVQ